MTFPTVQTADTKNGTQASNSTSWTLTYPTNLAAGDLIVAFVAADGAPDFTWPANWIAGAGAPTQPVRLGFAKKLAIGSETGTFTLTLSATEQGAWRIFRITGWEGTIGTLYASGASSGSCNAGAASDGTTSNPDPPSLDPTNWATEDTLWMAACALDTSRTISVYPLADLNTADVSGGSTGATLGICMANSAVSSLDPGTFTISSSDDWQAQTVAIRPAADVPRVPRGRLQYPQLLAQ